MCLRTKKKKKSMRNTVKEIESVKPERKSNSREWEWASELRKDVRSSARLQVS